MKRFFLVLVLMSVTPLIKTEWKEKIPYAISAMPLFIDVFSKYYKDKENHDNPFEQITPQLISGTLTGAAYLCLFHLIKSEKISQRKLLHNLGCSAFLFLTPVVADFSVKMMYNLTESNTTGKAKTRNIASHLQRGCIQDPW